MHKIYFDDRSILIGKRNAALTDLQDAKVMDSPDKKEVLDAVERFKSKEDGRSLILTSDNPDDTYAVVCSAFKEVDAAGGLVADENGRYLLIRRNSLWDLPKGHREKGERTERTAIREVEEETGLNRLVIEECICITDHCYFRDGTCHLKHTWWYRMKHSGQGITIPQTEEGISDAIWFEEEELQEALAGTYPSIVEVFQKASVIK